MKHELRVGVPRVDAIARERVKVQLQLHVARDALHHVHHAASPARDSERVNDFETGRMINYAFSPFARQTPIMTRAESACGGLIQT